MILAGTYAEFLLPLLIVIGLFTRLAALGMIGFIAVQTLTDLYGHGVINEAEIGRRLVRQVSGLDHHGSKRALWIFLLLVIVFKGRRARSRSIASSANNADPKSEL